MNLNIYNRVLAITSTIKEFNISNNLHLRKNLTRLFENEYYINLNKNLYHLNKLYNFLTFVVFKKGKILFVLPESRLNGRFIRVIKKTKHFYVSNKKTNKPGVLTNLLELNLHKKRKDRQYLPSLICILNKNYKYTVNITREAVLLKIPIISIVDAQNNLVNITYPLIGDLTFNNLKFYYFFISRVLMIKKDKKDKKK
jgi:ribosomal protein S2